MGHEVVSSVPDQQRLHPRTEAEAIHLLRVALEEPAAPAVRLFDAAGALAIAHGSPSFQASIEAMARQLTGFAERARVQVALAKVDAAAGRRSAAGARARGLAAAAAELSGPERLAAEQACAEAHAAAGDREAAITMLRAAEARVQASEVERRLLGKTWAELGVLLADPSLLDEAVRLRGDDARVREARARLSGAAHAEPVQHEPPPGSPADELPFSERTDAEARAALLHLALGGLADPKRRRSLGLRALEAYFLALEVERPPARRADWSVAWCLAAGAAPELGALWISAQEAADAAAQTLERHVGQQGLGSLFLADGGHESAALRAEVEAMLRDGLTSARTWAWWALIRLQSGDAAGALRAARRVVALSSSGLAWAIFARCALAAGALNEAIDAARRCFVPDARALEHGPQPVSTGAAPLLAARVLREAGLPAEALMRLDAPTLQARSSSRKLQRALCLEALGRVDDARAAARRGLEALLEQEEAPRPGERAALLRIAQADEGAGGA